MKVEVVLARPGGAEIRSLELPAGSTVRDALAAFGFREDQLVGIFGKRVQPDRKLAPNDRVEIYRPLEIDPKEARRRRAVRGRSPK
jgi:putative ubiquitin-RnfH superfamily antitoxin RatB of RatAB toxin-antitoxin module